MANIARGEVDIEINGDKYVMRPTFNAMEEFENKCGLSATTVLIHFQGDATRGLPQKLPGFSVVAAAIWSGIRGGLPAITRPNAPKYEEIGKLIRSEGIKNFIPIVLEYLTYAQTSDEDLQKIDDMAKKMKAQDI